MTEKPELHEAQRHLSTAELAEMFARESADLEAQWGRGNEVSTEDLGLALQLYRSFFTKLLAV